MTMAMGCNTPSSTRNVGHEPSEFFAVMVAACVGVLSHKLPDCCISADISIDTQGLPTALSTRGVILITLKRDSAC